MKQLAIYHRDLRPNGGVVTFTRNLIKSLYKHYNITLYFDFALNWQLIELSNYCHIKILQTNQIESDCFIYSSALPNSTKIIAKKVIEVIHADLENYKYDYYPKKYTTHRIAVSENTKNAFGRKYNLPIDAVIPNLPDPTISQHPKKENDIFSLITVSRISKEKGFNRMLELEKLIPVPFTWKVYGEGSKHLTASLKSKANNIQFLGFNKNPYPEIAKADYLVQLSDTEGMPYSIIESLQQRTPVITTNYPSAKELITDGVNGYILDMDLSNYKKIFDNKIKLTNFEPISTPNDWRKFID